MPDNDLVTERDHHMEILRQWGTATPVWAYDHITTLEARIKGLTEAVTKARDKFRHYEDLHRLKCTAEGDEKADRNRELADAMDDALRQPTQNAECPARQ